MIKKKKKMIKITDIISKVKLEILAEMEHERWARWQSYLHSKCTKNKDGSLTIPTLYVEHWERQIKTPYKSLTKQEKEMDRKEVRRYRHLIS